MALDLSAIKEYTAPAAPECTACGHVHLVQLLLGICGVFG